MLDPLSVAHHVVHTARHSTAAHGRLPRLAEEDNVFRLCKRPRNSNAKEARSAEAKRRRESKVGLLHLQNP